MALDNLRTFIGAIDAAGELTRVAQPVSVDRESPRSRIAA